MSRRILTHRGPNETLQPGVQDIAELRLAPTADVDDKQGIYVEDENALYFYDYSSVLPELPPFIIAPTAGVGRWIQHGYFSSGSPSTLYRRKWYQEQIVAAPLTEEIPVDCELVVESLNVLGVLTVNGTLVKLSDAAPPTPYSWPNVVPVDVDTVLPADSQLIVYQSFSIFGKLDVHGTLYIIP